MTVLDGVLQGIIQGITEFLPVSSDGHLTLFQHFFGLSGEGSMFFTVMLHAGTLLAVFAAYYKRIFAIIREFCIMLWQMLRGKFSYKRDANDAQREGVMILVTLIPLLGFYFIKDWFSALAEDSDIIVEGVCFLFTGTMLLLADRCVRGHKTAREMTVRDALIIGVFQGIAALPGVSRSGSTISAGLLLGYGGDFMASFSFIMGVPAVLGANLSEAYDAFTGGMAVDWTPILIGMAVSAVVGFFAVKAVQWLVGKNKFAVFAYYTLALGVLTLLAGLLEHFTGMGIVQLVGLLGGKA
ncbi:MAG: undecaprenyl-diphosphate phosphatase [Oscillospiraceae bacterium]|nr:undecaprenyl-diphosphate phosphatase [Oscillospiraceae bacterium]